MPFTIAVIVHGLSPVATFLVRAWREAVSADPEHVLCVRVAANVPEDVVHAEERFAGADGRVVDIGKSVEEGDARALVQNLVVRRREEAVGEAVSENQLIGIPDKVRLVISLLGGICRCCRCQTFLILSL